MIAKAWNYKSRKLCFVVDFTISIYALLYVLSTTQPAKAYPPDILIIYILIAINCLLYILIAKFQAKEARYPQFKRLHLSILNGEGHAGREIVTLTLSTDDKALQCSARAQFNLLLLDVYNGGHRWSKFEPSGWQEHLSGTPIYWSRLWEIWSEYF